MSPTRPEKPQPLKPYAKPQLERLGNVVALTASGSKEGNETGGNVFGRK